MPDSPVSFRCLEGRDELEALAPRLDALTARLREGAEHPWMFQRSDWLLACAEHHDAEVLSFVAESPEGELLAAFVAAMQPVRIGRLEPIALTFLGWPDNDFVEIPAITEAVRQQLLSWAWEHALQSYAKWECWMLREMDRDGASLRAMQQLAGKAKVLPRFTAFQAGVSPTVDLDAWERDGDPRNKRQRARARKYKRLEKEGGTLATEFVRLAPAAIPAMWQEFVDLEARSWRDLNAGTTVMHGSTGAQIARAVWERVASKGELGIAVLRLDGKVIAGNWGFFDGDRYLSVCELRDVQYSNYSVGLGLMEEIVQRAREHGVRWVDASRGNKNGTHVLSRYHGPVRQQVQLVMPRPGWRGMQVRTYLWGRRLRGAHEALAI